MGIHLEVPGEKPGSSQESHIEYASESQNDSPPAHRASIAVSAAERARRHLNARLANPLQGYTYNELKKMGRAYAHDNALNEPEDVRAFEIGACLAREPTYLRHATRLGVTDEELAVLEHELTHRWAQPRRLYLVVAICSLCAAVQGMGMICDHRSQEACSPNHRRNRCQWSATFLRQSIWHWRGRLQINLACRSR